MLRWRQNVIYSSAKKKIKITIAVAVVIVVMLMVFMLLLSREISPKDPADVVLKLSDQPYPTAIISEENKITADAFQNELSKIGLQEVQGYETGNLMEFKILGVDNGLCARIASTAFRFSSAVSAKEYYDIGRNAFATGVGMAGPATFKSCPTIGDEAFLALYYRQVTYTPCTTLVFRKQNFVAAVEYSTYAPVSPPLSEDMAISWARTMESRI